MEVDGLAGVRRQRGLTQRQVAEVMGVTPQRVGAIERAWPDNRIETVLAYVAACGGRLRIDIEHGNIKTSLI